MATVEGMLTLIASADILVDQVTGLELDTSVIGSSQHALATSIVNQMMTIEKVTVAQANEMTEKVRTSKFGASYQKMLAAAIARVMESSTAGKAPGKNPGTGTLACLCCVQRGGV